MYNVIFNLINIFILQLKAAKEASKPKQKKDTKQNKKDKDEAGKKSNVFTTILINVFSLNVHNSFVIKLYYFLHDLCCSFEILKSPGIKKNFFVM